MSDPVASELKRAVESHHGGTATLAQSVPVKETHAGAVVWEGVVHVFDLAGHPTASSRLLKKSLAKRFGS
jgi:hypothetical protein